MTALSLPYAPDQPPIVRKYPYVCPKAEWDGVSEQTRGRRLYWSMRSLAAAYLIMAQACPGVATGAARMRLSIVPAMFTVNYRPVAQRVLISACYCCPTAAPNVLDDPKVSGTGCAFQQLPDAPDGTERWSWTCLRPGCKATGLHDHRRWAIEATMLHNLATDHKSLAANAQRGAAA